MVNRSFIVFESSKGRKDLVFVTSDLATALNSASTWHADTGWTYRVYSVDDSFAFYVDKLTPIAVYAK
jgi:hypothetical protein